MLIYDPTSNGDKLLAQPFGHKATRPKAISKGVSTIEATEAAASIISSASYILKYTTTLTEPRACHDKFVC